MGYIESNKNLRTLVNLTPITRAAVGRGGVLGCAERAAGLAPLGRRLADLARCRLGAMDLRRRIGVRFQLNCLSSESQTIGI